ncbi:MAG: glycosyl hydrolase 115 family protein [Bacteroidota bacterium]
MKYLSLVLIILPLWGCRSEPADHNADAGYISFEGSGKKMALVSGRTASPIWLAKGEDEGVVIALDNFQKDVQRVTGILPDTRFIEKVPGEEAGEKGNIILAGTIGINPLIDNLVERELLDVSSVKGKWEASVTTVIRNPFPGVARALVIAGSDRRGTIFGIYECSTRMGVSPWYFWADVTPIHRDEIYVIPGRYILHEPAVKYRGIFINDEAPALAGWVQENYGSFNHAFYAHVYELILRMKGNYLWPAMWGRALYDDDSLNAPLAHAYGVVIGTTHHEPLMRAHVEWARYGNGPWDYRKNRDTIRAFWEEGIRRMGKHESIVSLGMRGDGDEPMTQGTAISLLEEIVADQRSIISHVTGKAPEETPQLWALYKEVQEYYDQGMRVPDDVTLLLCDDNWGNIRKLPESGSPERAGGYGIYYHFDYVGGPRNYKWLNTNQIERVWEQMHLAHAFGANQIWIVNVGDIKPMELPIQFFLDYAWDPDRWQADNLEDYYIRWAAQQFGETFAEPVAEILAGYTRFNARRKPELLSPQTYSLTHFRESDRVLQEYKELEELAEFIYQEIPAELRDAYYQLVLFPVKASANLNELYITAAMNKLYAAQGRSAASLVAQRTRELFQNDSLLTEQFHREMAGGKWNHMMSQTHIGYTYWQQPEQNNMPEIQEIAVPEKALMGVAVEHSGQVWPGSGDSAALPLFDAQNRQEYFVEVFNRGTLAFNCTITPSVSWLIPSSSSLEIDLQERVYFRVDWSQVPEGIQTAVAEISGPGQVSVPLIVRVDNRKICNAFPDREFFAENNGIVSMEAGHFQHAIDGDQVHWVEVPNLGRTLSSMSTLSVTALPSTVGGDSPRLEYEFCIRDTGTFEISSFLSPTLNFLNNQGLRFAVSVDDEKPLVIYMHENERPGTWDLWVSNNILTRTSLHHITEPGIHTLKWWRVDACVVLQKIVIRETGTDDPSYLGPPESLMVNHKPEG